jgi:Ca2+-binding RTX toxin-like protein
MAIIYGQNDSHDDIDGTDFRDIIYGGSPSRPFTNTGDDTIHGHDGADDIYGGDGDDHLDGDDGDDYLVGDQGDDLLNGGNDSDILVGGTGADTLNGGDNSDYLDGLEGPDTMSGNDGDDTIQADAGDFDTIDGGSGTDQLIFHAETFGHGVTIDISDPATTEETSDGTSIVNMDQLLFIGSNFIDNVTAGAKDDELHGRAGGDTLRGGNGDDLIYGGAGADRIEGGNGDDDLTGGARGDKFVFADNGGHDTVRDFESGNDVLDLTQVSGVDSFSDLDLTDQGSSVEVDYGTGSFVLQGVSSISSVHADDFLFA